MRRWIWTLLLVSALGGLAACAAQEEAKPAAAPPAPAAEAILPRKDAWEQEWERVLAAAKQEGKVSVIGFAAAAARRNLTEPFERKYGIQVEYLGMSGPEVPGKVRAERQAGQYLWDVLIAGTTTMLTALKPDGYLERIDPFMILPDVKDPNNWEGGLAWADKDHTTLAMTMYGRSDVYVNTNLVKSGEIKSYRDLLDPKWGGKIVLHDPRIGGPSQAVFTFFYMRPDLGLGPDFIREWAKQRVIINRDTRQQMEWVAQGRYPILIGGTPATALEMRQAGLPIAYVDCKSVKEGCYASGGWGNLGIFNRAPHPNAAKVYVNWLLAKDGQHELSKASEYASLRKDVPRGHVPAYLMFDLKNTETYTEKAMEVKDPLVKLLREVFPD